MLGIYYGNGWGAKSLPFMSTRLMLANGTEYPASQVFAGGVLNETALAEYGPPKLAATFAYSMFIANAAVGFIFHLSSLSLPLCLCPCLSLFISLSFPPCFHQQTVRPTDTDQ